MSVITRIKRPTYSTPSRDSHGRMVHVSTRYRHMPINPLNPLGPTSFRKVQKGDGITYRSAK